MEKKDFKVIKKLGYGSFSEVFQALDELNNSEIAIKVEPISIKHPQLAYEAKVYKFLHKHNEENLGIPSILYFSNEDDYNVMVMELLGPSLEDFFNISNRKFSLKTVLKLAIDMLSLIQFVHSCLFLHRDIKPENFLFGRNYKSDKVNFFFLMNIICYFIKIGEVYY